MTSDSDSWNYFREDLHYSDVLKRRLSDSVEMDSAKAMAHYLNELCQGDLHVLDFGGGPGHYYPVVKNLYRRGALRYTSVDIDVGNIEYGRQHFRNVKEVSLQVGSVLEPTCSLGDHNCIISANTLPHVPTIAPLLDMLAVAPGVSYFAFRMLVGAECVQIKKHLREDDFDWLFERNFQFNNIYSMKYITLRLGPQWRVRIEPDIFDSGRLAQHRLPEQERDPFYANRVSRLVEDMVFKGDVYMPWKFVLGERVAAR